MGSYRDGDLEAVVRGYTSSTSFGNIQNTCFDPFSIHQDDFVSNSYPGFYETELALDELEAFYKPFYSTMNTHSSNSIMTSSTVSSGGEKEQEIEVHEQIPSNANGSFLVCANQEATKYKRRKNQQKRVVMQVKEESLSSDKWAWRKYGQKPIKGSPYPRSYYRCSSTKGCLARKQVERSLPDPQTFIITYTADHCHPHPTRRNSLAGTTRNKFPKRPSKTDSKPTHEMSSPQAEKIINSPAENIVCKEEIVSRDDFVAGFDDMGNVNYALDMLECMKWFEIQQWEKKNDVCCTTNSWEQT